MEALAAPLLRKEDQTKGFHPAPPTVPQPRRHHSDFLYLVAIILLAALVRVQFLYSLGGVIDADEAIVGLMAKHIATGSSIPTFYYGQPYMGSFEPILVSVVFRLVGTSPFALQGVPLFFSLLFIVLVYAIAKEVAGRIAARVAALLLVFPPAMLLVWSLKARGGFIEIVVIGAVTLLLTLRWMRKEPTFLGLIPIALLLGFGWWVNNQIIYFMLTIAFAVLGRLGATRRSWKQFAATAAGYTLLGGALWLIGGLPFWWYNFTHDFESFGMFGSARGTKAFEQFGGVIKEAAPILLGARRVWHTDDVFRGASSIVAALAALVLVPFIGVRLRACLRAVRLDLRENDQGVLLIALLVAGCAVFSLSSFGWLTLEPRYLMPMYVALIPMMAGTISGSLKRLPLFGSALCAALIGVNLSSLYVGEGAIPGQPVVFRGDRVSRDHTDLIRWLSARNISWVRTNYWIGYRLAFETQEQVRFVMATFPENIRIPLYEERGREVETAKIPWVLVPSQALALTHALDALGYRYEMVALSQYMVVYNVKPRDGDLRAVDLSTAQLSASHNEGLSKLAYDHDPKTRWASATHQVPGMQFRIKLFHPISLRAVRYSLGLWPQDFPRGLSIQARSREGSLVDLLTPQQYQATQNFAGFEEGINGVTLSIYRDPVIANEVIFTQTGSHPIFDWSIAEVALYE